MFQICDRVRFMKEWCTEWIDPDAEDSDLEWATVVGLSDPDDRTYVKYDSRSDTFDYHPITKYLVKEEVYNSKLFQALL